MIGAGWLEWVFELNVPSTLVSVGFAPPLRCSSPPARSLQPHSTLCGAPPYLFYMPPPTVALTGRTRGDDIHDYPHDTRASDAAPSLSSDAQDVLRRSISTSEIVHDKYFIPGVVASGVFLLVVFVCLFFLFRKKAKPPGVQWATPQTKLAPDMQQQPRPSMYGHNASVIPGPPGSPDGSRRLSHFQRKSLPDVPYYGADGREPSPERPPHDVNGHNRGHIVNSTSQNIKNQPSTVYHSQPPTVAFSSPPYSHDHESQHQYSQRDYPRRSYLPQNVSMRTMTAPPVNAVPASQWQQNQQAPQNHPGAAPTRVSILSTDQSATQVGSDKDYYPGGYGKIGAPAQKPLDGSDGSPAYEEEEYFDPYGGIERGNTAGSRSQVRR